VLQDSGMKVLRVPGLAIYYSEHLDSVPESFKRLLYKTPVLHQTIVFITVRQAPPPHTHTHAPFTRCSSA